MAVTVIGAGVDGTGAHPHRTARDELGQDPRHRVEAVLHDMQRHVPFCEAVVNGRRDWAGILKSFASAPDRPAATFSRNPNQAHPQAKFVLKMGAPQGGAGFRDRIEGRQ